MSLDPHEYDLNELRDRRGTGVAEDGEPGERPRAGDALRSGHYRELLRLQSAAIQENLQKPYLETLPDSYAGEVTAFEWLEFLASKGGFRRTLDTLRYYRSLGWLSEAAERELREYLDGIETQRSGDDAPFEIADHVLSLIYIARMATV